MQSGANDGDGRCFASWQNRNEVDLTASWNKMDSMVPTYVRLDSRLPNPQLVASGMAADFRVSEHLILIGGYRFAELPQRSQAVHVPLVAVSTVIRVRRWTFVDRNRFEKLIGYGSSRVRYRNRVLLDRPFGLHHLVSMKDGTSLPVMKFSSISRQPGGIKIGCRSEVGPLRPG